MNLRLRERIALTLAPWLYVPYRDEREEAFKDLAEVAYLSRDAVWTSPRTLVKTALDTTAAERERLRLHANSARVCLERFRVRPESTDLLATAIRELDDAMGEQPHA